MSSIWRENLSTSSPRMVVAREMKMTPMMIEAQLNNERVPKYYAAAMSSLIGLFIMSHLLRYSFHRYATLMFKNSTIIRYQVVISRFLRSIAIRRVSGFTSAGHALVVLIYVVVNLALTFTNINWSTRIGVAKRCGWMALTNICFITILALKNTPLGFLAGYSYERLNCLHQIGGYTTITFVILHFGIMTDYFLKKDLADLLLENAQIAGITAASAILTMGISAILVRKLRYEAFYIIHILMFMLLIINIAIHRPDFTSKAVYITIITGCIWSTDRLIRISRMIWNSYNDRAIIQPLPNGGTRIILHHSTSRILPGSHCLLWIPKARAFETHPFTVVSATSNSMELVVAARDGFTRNLHELAIRKPGSSLRASFDGPYGALPDFARSADRLMLIAGGSGASFTIGVALRVIRQLEVTSRKRIDFIWAVKTREMLSWYSNEIAELQSSPLINLIIHTTGPSSSTEPTSTISPSNSLEPLKLQLQLQLSHISTEISEVQVDVEKNVPATPIEEPISSLCILPERPDAATLIRNAVGNVAEHERIAIAACGPDGLMRVVREIVANCITAAGPSVELHCEQFSW